MCKKDKGGETDRKGQGRRNGLKREKKKALPSSLLPFLAPCLVSYLSDP